MEVVANAILIIWILAPLIGTILSTMIIVSICLKVIQSLSNSEWNA